VSIRVIRGKKWIATNYTNFHELVFFWNRVVAAGSPRMTPGDSLHAEPGTFQNTPFLDGFNGVLGARWHVATMRAEKRGERGLVDADGKYK